MERSDFSINIWYLYIDGKIRKVWFFAPGCLNNFTQGWSFSVILAWDNQKGTFLTHFFNFGHEGAPNVTKITYNMKILWENSPRKKNWGSFVHRGLRYDFLRKKIWTVQLILQFNISNHRFSKHPNGLIFLFHGNISFTNIIHARKMDYIDGRFPFSWITFPVTDWMRGGWRLHWSTHSSAFQFPPTVIDKVKLSEGIKMVNILTVY